MMTLIGLLILSFPIFAVVVGAVATAKNRSFFGWFLLSFLITPFFALLALIAVPAISQAPQYGELIIEGSRRGSGMAGKLVATFVIGLGLIVALFVAVLFAPLLFPSLGDPPSKTGSASRVEDKSAQTAKPVDLRKLGID